MVSIMLCKIHLTKLLFFKHLYVIKAVVMKQLLCMYWKITSQKISTEQEEHTLNIIVMMFHYILMCLWTFAISDSDCSMYLQ